MPRSDWENDRGDFVCGCLGLYQCINHRKKPDQPIKPIYAVYYTFEGDQYKVGVGGTNSKEHAARQAQAFVLAGFLPVTVIEE